MIPSTLTPHAAAALYLLTGLESLGIPAASIDEAITEGYITDLHWCSTLEDFRERHGIPSTYTPGARTDQRTEASARARQRRAEREERRAELLTTITRRPGLTASDLARELDLSLTRTVGFLDELEAAGEITTTRQARKDGLQAPRLSYPAGEDAA